MRTAATRLSYMLYPTDRKNMPNFNYLALIKSNSIQQPRCLSKWKLPKILQRRTTVKKITRTEAKYSSHNSNTKGGVPPF